MRFFFCFSPSVIKSINHTHYGDDTLADSSAGPPLCFRESLIFMDLPAMRRWVLSCWGILTIWPRDLPLSDCFCSTASGPPLPLPLPPPSAPLRWSAAAAAAAVAPHSGGGLLLWTPSRVKPSSQLGGKNNKRSCKQTRPSRAASAHSQ